jgi:hypothetical protein
MIYRATGPALVNAIINHPDIRGDFEQGEGRIDSEEVVSNPDNIVLAFETGVAVFIGKGRGVYEGHIAILKAGRGKAGLAHCKEALDTLFSRYKAKVVVASVPLQLRAARLLCRLLGFVSGGTDLEQEHFVLEEANHGRSN